MRSSYGAEDQVSVCPEMDVAGNLYQRSLRTEFPVTPLQGARHKGSFDYVNARSSSTNSAQDDRVYLSI